MVESTQKSAPSESKDGKRSSSAKRPLFRVLAVVLVAVIAVEAFFIVRWVQVSWNLAQARRLVEQLEYEKAVESLANASRWNRNHPEVQFQLAVTYRHANKSREFEAHLLEAQRLGVARERIEHEKDLMVTQGGFFDSASTNLQKFIDSGTATDEQAAEIYDAMAKGYLAAYRLPDALRCLDFWIEWDPNTIVGHYHRGDVLSRMGNLRNAMVDYEFVLEQVPNHFETNLRVGRLLQDSNAIDQAIEFYRRAYELRPESHEAILALASCELLLNNQEKANELATELLQRPLDKQTRAYALELLGQIGLMQGKYADAVKHLEEALTLSPQDSDVNYTMGRILRSLGDSERATYFLDYSQQLKEEDLRFRDLTVRLVAQPNNNDYRFEIAKILFGRGQLEPAAMWLRTIVNEDPEHEPSHRMLADYYARTGRPDLARGHSEKAMLLSTRQKPAVNAPEEPNSPEGG